jgi:hypothetical protein
MIIKCRSLVCSLCLTMPLSEWLYCLLLSNCWSRHDDNCCSVLWAWNWVLTSVFRNNAISNGRNHTQFSRLLQNSNNYSEEKGCRSVRDYKVIDMGSLAHMWGCIYTHFLIGSSNYHLSCVTSRHNASLSEAISYHASNVEARSGCFSIANHSHIS